MNREENIHGGSMEKDGAAARPIAGARVHPMGERAAVERPGGGAHGAVSDVVVAAASICSNMPRTMACKPAQRRSVNFFR
jgi:hypothetical protein